MIDNKTDDYKSHKHSFNVYVEINSKTKLGQDLLEQYHREAKHQYMDIGRIGYHDSNGKYILDKYILAELITIPKLIITVAKSAVDRAGNDVYKLRTYMSKFGQLNFLLVVDKANAELILLEEVYIDNLNHKETYETPIHKLRYSPREDVPLREIFYKFAIKANPDDYGKCLKDEDSKINNIVVAKAKAAMTVQIANKVANSINQKALITSLNFLNKEGTYGKKVTKEYSSKVSKSKELNELSTSKKLENTLNNVLVKTLEQQTTKQDVKDKTNFKIYKRVLDVQLSTHNEVKKEVEKQNNKENLKEFLLDTYSKHNTPLQDEEKTNELKFKTFEKIIDKHYSREPHKEQTKPQEEDFKPKEIKGLQQNSKQDFYDFENKKLPIDFNVARFKKPVEESKKQAIKLEAKKQKIQDKREIKIAKKASKSIRVLNAECNLDREFERSKLSLGILPTDSKRKKNKAFKVFFSEENEKTNKKNKALSQQNSQNTNKLSDNIINKIEKQIRSQKVAKVDKKTKKQNKLATKQLKKQEKINIIETKKQEKLIIKQTKQEQKQQIKLSKQNKNKKLNNEQPLPNSRKINKKQNSLFNKINNSKQINNKNETQKLSERPVLKKKANRLPVKLFPKKIKTNNNELVNFYNKPLVATKEHFAKKHKKNVKATVNKIQKKQYKVNGLTLTNYLLLMEDLDKIDRKNEQKTNQSAINSAQIQQTNTTIKTAQNTYTYNNQLKQQPSLDKKPTSQEPKKQQEKPTGSQAEKEKQKQKELEHLVADDYKQTRKQQDQVAPMQDARPEFTYGVQQTTKSEQTPFSQTYVTPQQTAPTPEPPAPEKPKQNEEKLASYFERKYQQDTPTYSQGASAPQPPRKKPNVQDMGREM